MENHIVGNVEEDQDSQHESQMLPLRRERPNRRLLNNSIAIVTFVIVFVGIFSTKYGFIRTYVVRMQAMNALDDVRRLSAKQLIDDELIRAAVRSAGRTGYLRDTSRGVREAVFEKHQCYIFSPVFYSNPALACSVARYSEGQTKDNVWYEKLGIPVSVAPIIHAIRLELYKTGRKYLSSTAGLYEIVYLKSSVFFDEFSKLSKLQQDNLKTLLQITIISFIQFRDDTETREEYNTYLRLENEWRNDKNASSHERYDAWSEQKKVLQKRVGFLDSYLFAGRRFAEGGDALLNTYIGILTDVGTNISK